MAVNTIAVLNRLIDNDIKEEHISVSELVKRLGSEGFGLFMLIFCLPNALPIPLPPGVSTVFALPVLIIGAQRLLGFKSLWIPEFIGKRNIPYNSFRKILIKAVSLISKYAWMIKPRMEFLTGKTAEKAMIIIVMVLAGLISLPIPFGNLVPAVAIIVIAIGLVEKDGLVIIIGSIASVGAFILISSIFMTAFVAITKLFE